MGGLHEHPALLFWDVQNEPSWHQAIAYVVDEAESARVMEVVWRFIRHMTRYVKSLDPTTAIGIGHTFITDSEDSGTIDDVDIILFHDYSKTRARARGVYEQAVSLAARHGKPVVNNETGALCRGGNCDVALGLAHEFGMGWYLFKLMVEDGIWAGVHGVVYPDGTVRDPSVVAAILGFFRNRDVGTAIPPQVDLEHSAELAVREARAALARHASTDELLEAAEFVPNMLEGGEHTPMAWGPVARIETLRRRASTLDEVRAFTFDLCEELRRACQLT